MSNKTECSIHGFCSECLQAADERMKETRTGESKMSTDAPTLNYMAEKPMTAVVAFGEFSILSRLILLCRVFIGETVKLSGTCVRSVHVQGLRQIP